MSKLNLNHWFVKGNDFSISLMRYYVIICPISYNNKISYVMNVIDDENNKTFYFETIEESIRFTEDVVNNSHNMEMIIAQYNDFVNKPKVKRKI